MSQHECHHEEDWGMVKEVCNTIKSNKAIFGGIIITILIQIGSFLYMWGGLTQIVSKNTDFLWKDVSPRVMTNTSNIDKILAKMEILTSRAFAGDKND